MTAPASPPPAPTWFENLGKWDSHVEIEGGRPVSVLRHELKYLVERNKGGRQEATPEECRAVEGNLAGLAFSGGGIRSATFGLGVLEGLKELRLLKQFDYVSTVSGGGYLGAWLGANCLRAAARTPGSAGGGASTDWLDRGADWNGSIGYLRRYSKYLSPDFGFMSADSWAMVTIWLRNTLLVQLTVILAIATALLVPRLLMPAFAHWPQSGDWRWASVVLYLVAVAGIAGNQRRLLAAREEPLLDHRKWAVGLAAGVTMVAMAWMLGGYRDFDPFTNGPVDVLASAGVAVFLLAAGLCFLPVGVKIANLAWRALRRPDPPERLNYTQAWVQAVVVLPLMATALLVAAVLWGHAADRGHELSRMTTYGELLGGAWRYWPFPLALAFVSFWLLSLCSLRITHLRRALLVALLAPIPAVLVLHALMCAIMLLLQGWAEVPVQGVWKAFVWTPSLLLFALSLGINVLLGILGRGSTEAVREWWSRLGAWLAIYGFAWMLMAVVAVYGPQWSAMLFSRETWHGLSAGAGWVLTTAAGLMTGRSNSTSGTGKTSGLAMAREWLTELAPFVFIGGLLVTVATLLHLVIVNMSLDRPDLHAGVLYSRHWVYMAASAPAAALTVFGCVLAALVLFAWRVDINEFSLNTFYRSRLVRCYLGATRTPKERAPQNFTGFDENDDLPMADLRASAGPLHIVNCALNLGGSSDLALHTRHSASFTITPLAVGSHYRSDDREGGKTPIGFRETRSYGGAHGTTSLGKAISVSGAAASPNMGYHSSPLVAFALTMFNARLGWWFPSPRMGSKGSASPGFSLRYLLREMLASADDRSDFLMISDGGHFENLGVYELVRRRCRVIVASDAECDPGQRFEGLGTLIRMCEVDFGVDIEIDLASLRRDAATGWSRHRCAVGRIIYDPRDRGKDGVLIYLKASMNGHEDEAIRQYQASHPAFPHESTGNQFYGEGQFESYRQLGREIALQTFAPVAQLENPADPPTVRRMYKVGILRDAAYRLRKIWTPALVTRRRFAEHGDRLMQVWNQLGADQDLHLFGADQEKLLAEKWPDEQSPEPFRPLFFASIQIIQLMENVYQDLDLEQTWTHPDNEGWKTQFEIWARSPAIRKTWVASRDTFGKRFQYFCNRNFGLPVE